MILVRFNGIHIVDVPDYLDCIRLFMLYKKHGFAIIPDYSHSYKMRMLYLIVN